MGIRVSIRVTVSKQQGREGQKLGLTRGRKSPKQYLQRDDLKRQKFEACLLQIDLSEQL